MVRKKWPQEWIDEALRIGKEMWGDHYRVAVEENDEFVLNQMVCPSRFILLLTFETFDGILLIHTMLASYHYHITDQRRA